MVRCSDGSYYSGVATDVEERVKEHNWGVGAIFTSRRRPVKLVWWEEHPDQRSARKREREVKGWRREKKEGLIREMRGGSTLRAKEPSG